VSLILDVSVVLAWLLPDERGAAAVDEVLDRVTQEGAVVPGLWRLEVANALVMAERRVRLTAAQRAAALQVLAALPVAIDGDTAARAWTDTLALADEHRLTLYDAAYLELARRLGLPLATLDRELRAAGTALGIPLLGA
jgi:predicted nucleic acid-binding protein